MLYNFYHSEFSIQGRGYYKTIVERVTRTVARDIMRNKLACQYRERVTVRIDNRK